MRRRGWWARMAVASSAALAASILATGVAEAAAPSAPTKVVAVRGDQRATLTWTAPTSDGGTPLIGSMVTASPGGQTCWAPLDATGCTVWDLTNGVSYSFTVSASNDSATSTPSAASNSVVPVAGSGAFT